MSNQDTLVDRPTRATKRSPRVDILNLHDRSTLLVVGIAALVTFVAGWVSAPESPRFGQASAADVRTWFETNAGALRVYATASMVAAVGFIIVAAGLSALARRHLKGSMLSEVVVGSVSLVVALTVLDTAAATVGTLLPRLIDTTLPAVQDPIVRSWLAVAAFTHFVGDLKMAFIALLVAAGSLIALRLHLTNRWLCFAGLAVSAGAGLGTLSVTLTVPALYPTWFVGMFGLYLALAVLATSAFLTRRRIARASRPAV
jgi:hypothetical protein